MILAWLIKHRDTAAGQWIDSLHTTTSLTRATQRRERRALRRLHAWDTALTFLAAHSCP